MFAPPPSSLREGCLGYSRPILARATGQAHLIARRTFGRLTPTDFTRIAGRAEILGETPSQYRLVALLEADRQGRMKAA
jgi:hypothetical protein